MSDDKDSYIKEMEIKNSLLYLINYNFRQHYKLKYFWSLKQR